MITLKKIARGKEPENLQRFSDENIYSICGTRKLDRLCTALAVTQDLKYILNSDSCNYYQFEKFKKQDILDIIEDLKELAERMKNRETIADGDHKSLWGTQSGISD